MRKLLLNQELITFKEAAELIPGRPHRNTVRRWCERGVDGIYLESWRVGTRRLTSVEALEKFIRAQSGDKGSEPAAEAAEKQLDAMGVH